MTVNNLADIQSVLVRLISKKYKVIEQSHSGDFYLLVGPNKVLGYGVSIRLMEHASPIFNRYQAFVTLLKEDHTKVEKYNSFRLALIDKCGKNWEMYNRMKRDYIDQLIDENFKFE